MWRWPPTEGGRARATQARTSPSTCASGATRRKPRATSSTSSGLGLVRRAARRVPCGVGLSRGVGGRFVKSSGDGDTAAPSTQGRSDTAFTLCVSTGTRDFDAAPVAACQQLPGAHPWLAPWPGGHGRGSIDFLVRRFAEPGSPAVHVVAWDGRMFSLPAGPVRGGRLSVSGRAVGLRAEAPRGTADAGRGSTRSKNKLRQPSRSRRRCCTRRTRSRGLG
ncbi:DUF5133 domain-containing protein [Streptomyces sp. NBC_01185]|uniref:DUF5133 domain-containing protein n=1 Tax=Streptomyces sp. NBC_01185 TaxID=2903764 RepID=UPI0038661870